ncbi:Chaperone, partial [Globisporangium splendens]
MEKGPDGNDAPTAAQPVKPLGRLRMPKAIPAHLQQQHNMQLQQQQLQQQQLEMAFRGNASHLSHLDNESDVTMTDPSSTRDDSAGAERAGTQWQRDEHNRFMQALEAYGREESGDEWKKITAFVQTRSIEEVRLHGRQYLQQLVEQMSGARRALQSISSLGFDLTPVGSTTSNSNSSNDQNDPNELNHVVATTSGKPYKAKAKGTSSKTSYAKSFPRQPQHQEQELSVPSSGAATTAYDAPASSHFSQPTQAAPPARKHGRKPKVWTFEEDKIFETALASWSSDKPYSWPKIAASLPGKTAKDARNRFEKLVGDISIIEASDESFLHRSHPLQQQPVQPLQHFPSPRDPGLRSRISSPPPIQVPPASGKAPSRSMLESPGGLFPSSVRGSSRFPGGVSMLSPTFLDFSANEDKPPSSAANANSSNDPHDLLLLPSPLNAFSHRQSAADSTQNAGSSGSHRRPTSSATTSSSSSSAMASTSTNSESMLMTDFITASKATASTTPRGFLTTPRIWQELLSDDFKFDAKALPSSSASSCAMDTASQATQASTSTTGSGSGGSVHIGATTMISEDMSQVSLSAASSTSPPSEPAVVRALSLVRETRMECDEPMLEALGEENEEKEEGAVERDQSRESKNRDERGSSSSVRDQQAAASSHRRGSAQDETKNAESSSST